jgi:methylene-fatty-acyl-phospholipid synthase
MTWWLFISAALLLAIERIAYVLIWHYPQQFRAWCTGLGEPVDVVRWLFLLCKVIQLGVFAGWIYLHGGNSLRPPSGSVLTMLAGSAFIVVGQVLNGSVFLTLGNTGVFYGNRFGHNVPWRCTFPFSVVSHPQYVGTVLSIWGLFLIARFPHPDWFLLPALETAYYSLGARYEQ